MMIREKLEKLYDIGSSKRVFQSEWRSEGVPFYRAREIAKLAIDDYVDNELFIDEELYDSYVEKYGKPQPGDIMVTGVGTLGVCYIVKPDDKFYFKDGNILWFKQKAPDRILPEYLVKLFDSNDVREFISRNSSGTTVGTFTIQTAKKLEINLPSLEEQKRIIQKLAKIENIINNRKRELVLLDDCIKARFVEMFGNPVANEKGWNVDLCKNLTTKIGSGATPKGGKESYLTKGISLIRSLNVHNNQFVYDDLACISMEQAEKLNNVIIQQGDVLLNITGASVARCCIVPNSVLPARVNQHVSIIRCNEKLLPVFVSCMFTDDNFQQFLLNVATGGGATREAITKEEIEKFVLITPPIERQKKFVDFVEQIDKSKFSVMKGNALFM